MKDFERRRVGELKGVRDERVKENPTRVTRARGDVTTQVGEGLRAGEGGRGDLVGGEDGEVMWKE